MVTKSTFTHWVLEPQPPTVGYFFSNFRTMANEGPLSLPKSLALDKIEFFEGTEDNSVIDLANLCFLPRKN